MLHVVPLEILVVVVVALLVFGPKEITKVAGQLAKGWREVQRFQASLKRDLDEVLREADEDEAEVTPAPVLPAKAIETHPVEGKQAEAKPVEPKPVEPGPPANEPDTPPDAS